MKKVTLGLYPGLIIHRIFRIWPTYFVCLMVFWKISIFMGNVNFKKLTYRDRFGSTTNKELPFVTPKFGKIYYILITFSITHLQEPITVLDGLGMN